MNTIRVLVADSQWVVRAGLRAITGADTGLEVVGEAGDGSDAARLALELDPDVVVTEVALPGTTGAEVAARVRVGRPDRKVLALTTCEDGESLQRMLAAGATGYVLKRSGADELVRAIRAVAGGATYLDPAVAGHAGNFLCNGGAGEELSAREGEVIRLIALGYSNKEIAARLRLSVKTVETYKTRSMEKLDINSRVGIVRYAIRRGWLTNGGASDGATEPAPPARPDHVGGC